MKILRILLFFFLLAVANIVFAQYKGGVNPDPQPTPSIHKEKKTKSQIHKAIQVKRLIDSDKRRLHQEKKLKIARLTPTKDGKLMRPVYSQKSNPTKGLSHEGVYVVVHKKIFSGEYYRKLSGNPTKGLGGDGGMVRVKVSLWGRIPATRGKGGNLNRPMKLNKRKIKPQYDKNERKIWQNSREVPKVISTNSGSNSSGTQQTTEEPPQQEPATKE